MKPLHRDTCLFLLLDVLRLCYYATGDQRYEPWNGSEEEPQLPSSDENCNGELQSPIDINLSSTITAKFKPLRTNRLFKEKLDKITIIKDQHTVGVLFRSDPNEEKPTISGGPLTDFYYLDHVHFHWAPSNASGSEHSVNGIKYPLEMHAAYYNQQFESLEAAIDTPYGILMVAYIFEIHRDGYPAIDVIQESFENLKPAGYREATSAGGFSISELLPSIKSKYVTYKGSLTAPPCSEYVNWIVSLNTLPVSVQQLGEFRSLYANDPSLTVNTRRIQDTNGRPVYFVP